jgi:hypothetical protein
MKLQVVCHKWLTIPASLASGSVARFGTIVAPLSSARQTGFAQSAGQVSMLDIFSHAREATIMMTLKVYPTTESSELDIATIRRRVASIKRKWSPETVRARAIEGERRRSELAALLARAVEEGCGEAAGGRACM